mmetsp:Transcript_33719/g.88678  ORF Transcript_33719/g.88678 Transcript_33719/m.88678 type:complete len:205 (+) Transcript_33719:268-882(+)
MLPRSVDPEDRSPLTARSQPVWYLCFPGLGSYQAGLHLVRLSGFSRSLLVPVSPSSCTAQRPLASTYSSARPVRPLSSDRPVNPVSVTREPDMIFAPCLGSLARSASTFFVSASTTPGLLISSMKIFFAESGKFIIFALMSAIEESPVSVNRSSSGAAGLPCALASSARRRAAATSETLGSYAGAGFGTASSSSRSAAMLSHFL